MSRYAGREIYSVDVSINRGVTNAKTEHAKEGIGCEVSISLKGLTGGLGPEITMKFAIDPMPNGTLTEIEAAAIACAHDLMARVLTETPEGLIEASAKRLQDDLEPYDYEQMLADQATRDTE